MYRVGAGIALLCLGIVLAALLLAPPFDQATGTPRSIPVSPTGINWPSTPTNPVGGPGSIVAVYPNPVADNDTGEYITLSLDSAPAVTNWTISDNETTVQLPPINATGRLIVSSHPDAVSTPTNTSILALDERLSLTNGGERLTLRQNGTLIDTVTYPAISEAELYHNGSTQPLGMTDHPTWRAESVTVQSFVLPDDPTVPGTVLGNATDRVFLAGYTLTSHRVASRLVQAARRGVDVRVLIEGGPVGGTSRRTTTIVDRLLAAGVSVRVVDGARSRWRFHHAKYAVVDDEALILTENWQPAGTGGEATRGWGMVVSDPGFADRLATVFHDDHAWRGTRNWQPYLNDTTFQPPSPATGSYHQRFPPVTTAAAAAELLVAPDNAERRLLKLLRGAEASIQVLQPTIGNRTPLLAELVNAARRGVTVEILLGGSWYLESENQFLVKRLRRIADREHLPLAIRTVEPRSRYAYLHAKGVIVDGEAVVVGSINWNTVSTRENREVAVLLYDKRVARFYQRVFRADWRGAAWRLPVGTLCVTGVVVGAGIVVTVRMVTFAGRPGGPRQSRHHPSSQRERQEQPPAFRERT